MTAKSSRLSLFSFVVILIVGLLADPHSVWAEEEAEPRRGAARGRRAKAGTGREQEPQRYSIEQAVSDRAQLHTIAFSGLAFITGDFGASTFMPPGKVCDFFGFQYMRDIDAAGKGHNPMFLNRVAGNVLKILDDEQLSLFQQLAREQAPQMQELAVKRLPLIEAFHRELAGEIPAGSRGLNQKAVIGHVGDVFALDAEMSYRRAQVFALVAASLTQAQKDCLDAMKFGDFNSWPEVDGRPSTLRGVPKLENVAYMTYASEFFSWLKGSVDADVYFCPERHGTYFGGFFMKDMPAMGKRDYDISTAVTGDSGEAFLETLTDAQCAHVISIIDRQRKTLAEIVQTRRRMSLELRKFLVGQTPDRDALVALGRCYGELDGQLSYYYATAFALVNRTLTDEQRSALHELRDLEGYPSPAAHIYSQALKHKPDYPDTDVFFREPPEENR